MSVAAAASLFKAGSRRMLVARVDSDGYPMGTAEDPEAPVPGEVYDAHLVMGYVSNTAPSREIEKAVDQSDGKNYGSVNMGINTYGEGEVTLSQKDEALFNLIRRAVTDTTLSSEMVITAANNTQMDGLPMIVMFIDRVKDQKGSGFYYDHTIYHNCEVTITGEAESTQSGGTNPANYTLSYAPSPAGRLSVMGYSFADTDLEVLEDDDTHSFIRSRYPLFFSTYIGDGTTDPWVIAYRPMTTSATGDAGNVITKEGVLLAVTSVSTTTKTFTPTALITSGHRVVTLVTTQYRE